MGPQGSVFEGKSLDEAVRKGLDALGLSRAEVVITMLEEGSGGFFGLGARPYRVRVAPRPGGAIAEPVERAPRRERGRRDDRRGGRGGRDDRRGRGERGEGRGEARGERRDRGGEGRRHEAPREEPRGERRGEPRVEARGERRDEGRGPRREERRETAGREGGRREEGRRGEGRRSEGRRDEVRRSEGRRDEGRDRDRAREDRREPLPSEVVADEREMMAPAVAAAPGVVSREREGDEDDGGADRRRRRRGRRGGRRRRGEGGEAPGLAPAAVEGGAPFEESGPAHEEYRPAEPAFEPRESAAVATAESVPGMGADQLAMEGRRWTEQFLQAMGFEPQVSAKAEGDRVEVTVQVGEGERLLTGDKGEVRQALQHLLNRMVNRGEGSRYHLQLEINDFWKQREGELEALAREMATRAVEAQDEVVSEYLNSQERRIIHVTLREDPRVKTYAIGTGMIKRIAVAPAHLDKGERESE